MAGIAATGVLFGSGPIAHAANPSQSLFGIQLVVGVLSLIFLLFTSIVEERKESELALRSSVDKLQSALEQIRAEDQNKSDFIAILAHELRNPLSPMLSSLEVMKQNGLRPENAPAAASIASHLHVLARLLDDLLDISRVSQKKFKLQRQATKLRDVIAQSLEMAAPHIAQRGHTLTVIEPNEELWLEGDPVRLAQIFVNLLINAAKYTDPGGKVRLEAKREDGHAVVEVSDTGIGIEPTRLQKIFEAFGTGDPGVRRSGGLHIGLSLAKRMTELHHGELEAHSSGTGRGSAFVVRLPLLPTAPLMPEESVRRGRSRFSKEALESARKDGGSKVLVVDDNEAAADSLGKLLEHNGHHTLIAYDAPDALKLCDEHQPAAALLDIGLPTMDGYELARHLRQKFGGAILLIALTGYGQSEDKQKAKEAGFDEHLTKPVSIVDVERVLLELRKNN
jgi:signal transduction histidine kinase/CheY-like chemotaxis protein